MNMKSSWGEDAYLLEGVENPLDDCYIVTLENSKDIKAVSSKISTLDNVKNVEYNEDVIENFVKISNSIRNFGAVLNYIFNINMLSYNIKYYKSYSDTARKKKLK